MKATDFAMFCTGGRYAAELVMVQLRRLESYSAQSDGQEAMISPARLNPRAYAVMQVRAQGRPLTDEDIKQLEKLPDEDQPIPPLPVLVGRLEIAGDLLVLTYKNHLSETVHLSIHPDDVQHLSTIPKSRIVAA